ncbi:MAG TPA: membrane protein insertase YidC [Rudaea sp.]|nr:membrane protein insertase YidC [Rudaea sp.]
MSNPRTLLLVALAFMAMLLWQAWETDYTQRPTAPETTGSNMPSVPDTSKVGETSARPTSADVPKPITGNTPPPPATATPKPNESNQTAPSVLVDVRTDLLHLQIETNGGAIVQADLLDYPAEQKDKNVPVRLLNNDPTHYFVAETGLVSSSSTAPDHNAKFSVDKTSYALAPGQNTLEVPLTWTDAAGLTVRKTYVFTRGSYLLQLQERITNSTQTPWSGNQYRQLQRVPPVIVSHGFAFSDPERYAFTGAAWYSPEDKFQKLAFKKFETDKLCRADQQNPTTLDHCTFKSGWSAMLQHYFFAAWIPQSDESDVYQYATSTGPKGETRYLIRSISPTISVAPGKTANIDSHLYIGPTLVSQLDAIEKAGIAKGLTLTADYGMLTPIAQPLHWILVELHALVRNWGLAIILLVLLIKLAMFKLSEAQYKSMAKMKRLQPRMQALKERYGDDKQKLSAATMELYKKEKINPLGGCLPTLIQIPVFFALYYVLLESVELRQAPFFGWIHNLSAPDPYYILPIVNAAVMVGAQLLAPNSPGMDPMQAKMMKAMPVVFAVLFLFFPAGLVLYYTVNGGLSLLQQWIITRRMQAADKRAN